MSPISVISFEQHYSLDLLKTHRIIAMGKGSAEQLRKRNIPVEAYPQHACSKALLELEALQSSSLQNVCIVSGEQGNPLLAQTLAQRGINVQHCFTHQRQPKQYDSIPWAADDVDLTVCTSSLNLHYFNELINTHHLESLKKKPLLVITENMRERAHSLHFKTVSVATGAHQLQLLDAITAIL